MSAGKATDFAERVYFNQELLASALRPRYDFVVCGAGSSGSVVARRLAENPDCSVLLLEAGGDDSTPAVTDPALWPDNILSERDWGFRGVPNPRLNGRSITFSMGKVLGGGSAINVMVWARGHQSDWDFFAEQAGDPAWSYKSVLDIYRRIEDWHGSVDPRYRGTGGPVFVQPVPQPSPLALATVSAAASIGIPTFEHPNGQMMEGSGGAAICDIRIRSGKRQSVFRSYTYPYLDRTNLTVLPHALVTRVTLAGNRATGVQFRYRGENLVAEADSEVVLSLGAIHTPKVLMYSGIGDEAELSRVGIRVQQHLQGVGRNFQDHVGLPCVWQDKVPPLPRSNLAESTVYWSTADSATPDVFICQTEMPLGTYETGARFGVPTSGWTLVGGLAHPKSRGRLRLTGPDPRAPIQIDANTFGHSDDGKTAMSCVELCREIGNAPLLRSFVSREVMPGNLSGAELDGFIRDVATTYWHPAGTAKMGPWDSMSVVDGALRVYGIDNLRVADSSIMPRITTGNTMAPCVVIGERAAQMLISDHSG